MLLVRNALSTSSFWRRNKQNKQQPLNLKKKPMLTHSTNKKNQGKLHEQETSETGIFIHTNFTVDGRQT
jgi:hypothetical protein